MKTLLEAIFLSLALLLLGHFCYDYLKESVGLDLMAVFPKKEKTETESGAVAGAVAGAGPGSGPGPKVTKQQEVLDVVPPTKVLESVIPVDSAEQTLPDNDMSELNDFIKKLV